MGVIRSAVRLMLPAPVLPGWMVPWRWPLLVLLLSLSVALLLLPLLRPTRQRGGRAGGRALFRGIPMNEEELSTQADAPDSRPRGGVVRGGEEQSEGAEWRWRVEVELDGQTLRLSVPKRGVESKRCLQKAVVQACMGAVGPSAVPQLWARGEFETLTVQFRHPEVS